MAEQDERERTDALVEHQRSIPEHHFDFCNSSCFEAGWNAARRSSPAPAPIDATCPHQVECNHACCLAHGTHCCEKAGHDPDAPDAPAPAPIEKIAEEIAEAALCQRCNDKWESKHLVPRILTVLRRYFTDEKQDA